MRKVAATITLGLVLVACFGNASAVEMSMPTGDFAHSGSGSGEADTTTAAMRDAGAMRDAATRDSDTAGTRERVQPDSSTAHADTTHPTRGTDAASSAAATPSPRARHNAHWQSLLPGVMK